MWELTGSRGIIASCQLLTSLTLDGWKRLLCGLLPKASINNTLTCPNTNVGHTQNNLKDKDLETVSSSEWALNIKGRWLFGLMLFFVYSQYSTTGVLLMRKNWWRIQNFLLCFKELRHENNSVSLWFCEHEKMSNLTTASSSCGRKLPDDCFKYISKPQLRRTEKQSIKRYKTVFYIKSSTSCDHNPFFMTQNT